MLIRLGIFVFGLLFVIRISKFNDENKVVDANVFEKMIVANIFLTLLLIIIVFNSVLMIWICVMFSFFTFAVTIFVTRRIRETLFRQDFVDYLDRVIANVRTGQGFLFSLEKANEFTSPRNQKKIHKLIESLQYTSDPQFQAPLLTEIFDEFRWVQRFPSKTLQRLLGFRRNMKIEEKFRRKSGRIVRQVGIQVMFLLFLYIGLMFFVGSYFGFRGNIAVILISASLFLLGLVLFYYLGSQKLWKV